MDASSVRVPRADAPLTAQVCHRAAVQPAGGRAATQVLAVEMVAASTADATMISKNGTSITSRSAATRFSQGCCSICSRRGSSSSLVSRVNIANLEARRGSHVLSELSILLRMRSWQAGKLISLLLSA
jgi:hypothetical protein